MQLIHGIQQLKSCHRPSAVSIGNYDGVHLGHQHVVQSLLQQAKLLDIPSTVITFSPLVKEFFKHRSVIRLSSLEQRAEQLFELGVDQVLSIEFNADFAAYSPQRFVQEVLLDGLGVRYLSVGDDFRFGKDRAGDFDFLKESGREHGFSVAAHETFNIDGERVSSGRIRNVISESDFVLAEKLLGRPYSISGVVVKGQQLGRTLGFPTANIILDDALYGVNGVYAVQAKLANGELVDGVANVGTRPTVDGKENRLEVHLFDFDSDLYGQTIDTRFVEKIRNEKKFDGIDALVAQIKLDDVNARAICAKLR